MTENAAQKKTKPLGSVIVKNIPVRFKMRFQSSGRIPPTKGVPAFRWRYMPSTLRTTFKIIYPIGAKIATSFADAYVTPAGSRGGWEKSVDVGQNTELWVNIW